MQERLDDLQKEFKEIAETLFFGGYFDCGDCCVYIREVELYYNDEEEGCINPIRDKSMFHTTFLKKKDLPYFEMGHLYAHPWGFDLTFEKAPTGSDTSCYRASVLLKSFVVTGKNANPNYDTKNIKPSGELRDYFLKNLSAFGDNELKVKWVDYPHVIPDRILSEPKYRKNIPSDKDANRKWRYELAWRSTKTDN